MRMRSKIAAAAVAVAISVGLSTPAALASGTEGKAKPLPFKATITGQMFSGPEDCEPALPGRSQCTYRISGTATATRIGTIQAPAFTEWFGFMTEYFTLATPDGTGGYQTPYSATFTLAKSDGSGTVVLLQTGFITGTVFGPDAVSFGTHRSFSGPFTIADTSSGIFAGATGGGTATGDETYGSTWSETLTGTITYSASGH